MSVELAVRAVQGTGTLNVCCTEINESVDIAITGTKAAENGKIAVWKVDSRGTRYGEPETKEVVQVSLGPKALTVVYDQKQHVFYPKDDEGYQQMKAINSAYNKAPEKPKKTPKKQRYGATPDANETNPLLEEEEPVAQANSVRAQRGLGERAAGHNVGRLLFRVGPGQ